MIFLLQRFFLLAIDLLLAMTLSCLFYAFVCISIAFLTCFIIIFSFGIMERNIDVKGRAIVILMSNSSIGRMFARNLDKAGFRVAAAHWPPREERTATEEECSSSMEVAQLHMTEDEYQKTMKTFIESHLSLKGSAEEDHFGSQNMHHEASPSADTLQRGGTYGLMKKPSILIWEEEEPDAHSPLCRSPLLPAELCPDFPEEKPAALCASAEVQKLRAGKETHGALHVNTVMPQ
ncbi:estradiol 17-beta-dehydrogenase 2-like [Grus japonensis]|uniref:Estradiol 17-beta-dehydrogenase 2-like n=1 Tax=Grus japonensis TaxID=30415 RepID=A0ABC9WQN0_GRUJA